MGRSHNDSFESRILGLKYLHAPLSTPGDADAAPRFHQNTVHLSISIHIGMYFARNLSLSYRIEARRLQVLFLPWIYIKQRFIIGIKEIDDNSINVATITIK